MASDYEKICLDNIRRRGEEFDDIGRLISEQLYSDRTHFIFELLQNAEDALERRHRNNPENKLSDTVKFVLFKDRLEFRHFGELFNHDDVKGISDVLKGTKSEDKAQIGTFGIGFKSVYAFTSTPEIHSGDEHFIIERYIRPRLADKIPEMPDGETVFIFPFNHNELTAGQAFSHIENKLKKIGSRILLFLKHISEIEWKINDQNHGQYLKESKLHGKSARKVTVIGQHGNDDEVEEWLVFERRLDITNGSSERFVEVAFKLKEDEKSKKQKIQKIQSSPLIVYFPTKLETRLGFLVQGPYDTTASRSDIEDNEWNKSLIEKTAILLTEQVLPSLKEIGLLTVSFMESLPIRMDDFPEGSMFYPVVSKVREALMNEDLLPADDGTFVAARNAKLARGVELRKLLNQDQLRLLFQATSAIKWLSDDITQDRTTDLRSYLMNELDVEEITPDGFARKLSLPFLTSQTDEWFIGFYKYLSGQEALWRSPRWAGDTGGVLRSKPILRLQDDSHKIPFRPDGTPNAFLPPPEDTDFPVVKREIVRNEQVGDFLKRLRLSEPDVFDDIVEKVLPRYTGPDASSISPHEHIVDIQKILRAMRSDSETGKKKVIQAARQTPFLKALDQNGLTSFKKPSEIYFPDEKLKDYFSGSSDVWFLNETEGRKEWSEIGVESKPRFQMVEIDLPWEEKSRLRRNQGHTRDIETHDYYLDGLESFMTGLLVGEKTLDRHSLLLWDFLLEHLKVGPHYYFYEGEYKWFYYQERSARFDATWKSRLLSHAWLPKKGDDHPYKPMDLYLADLPDSFNRDERLAELLGMRKDVVAKLAEEAGVPAEDIELLRQHPEEFKQWKAAISAQKQKLAFPERASSNPERRRERLAEQLGDAPNKEYEQRDRSVRTTRGAVDPVLWLRNQYKNEAGQMICQVCKEEMPFRKRDGEHYFEAVAALSRDHFPMEHEAQFLALCPLCAAMYKEFVKQDEGAMVDLKNALMNTDDFEVPLRLGELDTSIRFVETHYHDIKTILEEQE